MRGQGRVKDRRKEGRRKVERTLKTHYKKSEEKEGKTGEEKRGEDLEEMREVGMPRYEKRKK